MKYMIGVMGLVAAAASFPSFAAGSGTVAQGAAQAVTTANSSCDLLANDVTLQVSKNSVGAWDCTTNIGVATGSTAGKGDIFTGSSAGGKIAATGAKCTNNQCTTTMLTSPASSASTSGGASGGSGS